MNPTYTKVPFVCDAAKSKQYKYLPGSHIPIISPSELTKITLDYLLILPWNIAKEVARENAYVGEWGGKFVTSIPRLRII